VSRPHWGPREAARSSVLIIPGRTALSASRQASALAKVREVSPHVTSLEARWARLVVAERELTAAGLQQLGQMLSYGAAERPVRPSGGLETVETLSFVVTPRVGTVSPWSSKATDIAHVCGLTAITRIERGTEWTLVGDSIDVAKVAGALSDRMTESVIIRES